MPKPPATARAKAAHRRLYRSDLWQALRIEVLERDGWLCRATGVFLVPGRKAPNAALVDHITPHRGDLALFFDPANCRSVSKEYHDSEKQRAEKVAPTAARGPGGGPIP